MKKHSLLLVLLAFVAPLVPLSNSLAGTHIVAIGGGGGDKHFEDDFTAIQSFVTKSRPSSVYYSYGGAGQTGLAQRLKGNTPFTPDAYDAMIRAYTNRIQNAAPGDQFIVFIGTHGSNNVLDLNHTHTIATADTTLRSIENLGDHVVSLDSLKDLIDAAEQRGVKLAIVDGSCFSGATRRLAVSQNLKIRRKVCLITATSENHLSYVQSFNLQFLQHLAKGKNLEEIFLEARANSLVPEFPTISSPHHDRIYPNTYPALRPLLFYSNPGGGIRTLEGYLDLFAGFEFETEKSKALCDRESEFQNLIHQISQTAKVMSSGPGATPELEAFKDSLQRYQNLQNEMIDTLKQIKKIRALSFPTAEENNKKAALLADFQIKVSNTYLQARDVAIRERKFYEAKYRFVKGLRDEPDPCKDFVL